MELFNTYPFLDATLAVRSQHSDLSMYFGRADIFGKHHLAVKLEKEKNIIELFYSDEDMKDLMYSDYIDEILEAAGELEEQIKGNSDGTL